MFSYTRVTCVYSRPANLRSYRGYVLSDRKQIIASLGVSDRTVLDFEGRSWREKLARLRRAIISKENQNGRGTSGKVARVAKRALEEISRERKHVDAASTSLA